MSQPSQVTPSIESSAATPPAGRHSLLVLRLGSALVAAFALGLYVIGLLTYVRVAYAICAAPPVCSFVQLTPEGARTLTSAGISVPGFITLNIIVNIGASLVWFVVAAVLFWRRSDLPMALLVAVQLVMQGATSTVQPLIDLHTEWAVLAIGLQALNTTLLFYVFALFPNGRFIPSWFRWLGLVWAALMLATLAPGPLAQIGNSFVAFLCMLTCVIGAQAYRYWRVSNPTERQQTKWVVLALAATLGADVVFALPTLVVPALSSNQSLYQLLVFGLSGPLFALPGPIALAFALLRYRLYDIDIIIRRTLIYGTLTAILAAVYFAVVLSAQVLGDRLTGQTQPPAWLIVASTLLIAALFTPLRRRIQAIIDKRFYRRKYDAARTLEAFAATLRTETDLSELSAHLVGVVQQTMQPAHVSLWLRRRDGSEVRP